MNLQLKNEMALTRYEGMSSSERLAEYLANTLTVPVKVPLSDLNAHLFATGLRVKIKGQAANGAGFIKIAANELLDLFSPSSHMQNVDMTSPAFLVGLNEFVTQKIFEQTEADSITNMGTQIVHISEMVPGLPKSPSIQNIIDARNL